MEDLDGEYGFSNGAGYREGESLVPDWAGGSRIVGVGGETVIRVVEVQGGVGLEIAVSPIDVLEVLGGDDGDL